MDADDAEPTLDLRALARAGQVPAVVAAALAALDELSGDFVNGGYELVAWNHNPEAVRGYGRAFLAAGAIENGELLLALADALDRFQLDHGELAIAADPLPHFQRFRQQRRGASAGIPQPDDELAEVLAERVRAAAASSTAS